MICIRAGIEMTKEQWFSVPKDLRDAYWEDTDWGHKPASPDMVKMIAREAMRWQLRQE